MITRERSNTDHVESSTAAVGEDNVVLGRLEVAVRPFAEVVGDSFPRRCVADRVAVAESATRTEAGFDGVLWVRKVRKATSEVGERGGESRTVRIEVVKGVGGEV